MATSDARGISQHGIRGRMSRNPTSTLLRERKPRHPMYRRRETKLVAKGHETSFIGHRN